MINPKPECLCSNWIHVSRQRRDGVTVVVKQCTNCGRSLGNVKRDKFDVAMLPVFNQKLVDDWDARYEVWRQKEQKLYALKLNDWFLEYNQYLKGKHWPRVRFAVLRRDPMCQVCFERPSEQVHHVSYEGYKKYGISFPVECIGICARCHEWLHKKVEP